MSNISVMTPDGIFACWVQRPISSSSPWEYLLTLLGLILRRNIRNLRYCPSVALALCQWLICGIWYVCLAGARNHCEGSVHEFNSISCLLTTQWTCTCRPINNNGKCNIAMHMQYALHVLICSDLFTMFTVFWPLDGHDWWILIWSATTGQKTLDTVG
jgi:hypothetical protein